MKGTRHSEQQIIAMLKQGEAGLTTSEFRHGFKGREGLEVRSSIEPWFLAAEPVHLLVAAVQQRVFSIAAPYQAAPGWDLWT